MTIPADSERIRDKVRERLLSEADGERLDRASAPVRRLRVREVALRILREEHAILSAAALTELVNQVSDEVVGLGPIERLLRDPEVSEVMVNGADDVYVERKGRIERVPGLFFEGEEQVLHLIERIVTPLGLRVDESSPYVDARLSDGSRVNAIIPPLSLCGPVMTVRKFAVRALTPEDLVASGTLTRDMVDVLARCVRARMNMIVSGGAGSGKTTLLNVLSSFIFPSERLITIEDAAELRLSQPHVISLEARPPNVEGLGEVTVRALVRNALRMRPDRILVGEVRGGEALDMLQAMNTRHEGSMSTAHANSPGDLLSRLETMAMMSDIELPVSHVREQIASAVDVVVHMARLADGRRAVTNVASVEGLRDGAVLLTDVFVRDRHGASSDDGRGGAGRQGRRDDWMVRPRGGSVTAHAPGDVRGASSADAGQPPSPPMLPNEAGPMGDSRWSGSLRRLGALAE
ncbi:MAG TPA: CpaF family protein [Actinomycetota bacterium]|nr:CpaF family protein [Actinomycetota bacterium]